MADAIKDASNWWPVAVWKPYTIPLPAQWRGSAVECQGSIFLIGSAKGKAGQRFKSPAVNVSRSPVMMVAPMRVPRYGFVAAAFGSHILAAGGVSYALPEASEKLASVEIYDINSLSWSPGSTLPYPLGWAAGGVVNNRLIVAGGFSDKRENRTLILDMGSGVWRAAAPMPEAVSHAAGAIYKGRLYVFGGIDWKSFHQKSCFIYDVSSDSWTKSAQMPDPRTSAAAVTVNDEIWITGGTRDWGGFERNDIFVFNPATNLYGSTYPMCFPRSDHIASIINGTVCALGGNAKWSSESANWNFIPVDITPTSKGINIQYSLWSTQGPVFERGIAGTMDTVNLPSFRHLVLKMVGIPATASALIITNKGQVPIEIGDGSRSIVLHTNNRAEWKLETKNDIHLIPTPT